MTPKTGRGRRKSASVWLSTMLHRLQTWERQQDRERAEMLQGQLSSLLAAIRMLASFGVGMIMT